MVCQFCGMGVCKCWMKTITLNCRIGVKYLANEHQFFDREGVKWFRWNGGECPVRRVSKVEIYIANGFSTSGYPDVYSWSAFGTNLDVIAYRIVEEK